MRREEGTVDKQDIGLIGLAVMGQNLVLNMERNGYSVGVFNRTVERTREFIAGPAKGKRIVGHDSLRSFVKELSKPRRIILMVKAGEAVDAFIKMLIPYLSKGDLLIDGGNSHFPDTDRRNRMLADIGILYIGTGVSGGEEGALKGPSIMPGGQREAYELVRDVFTKIAAKVDDGPCCAYMGAGSAGHYVKMVHNGIEYGIMSLIGETYDILKTAVGMDAFSMGDLFDSWNRGELNSYLIEITAAVLKHKDPDTGKPLVDVIVDKAGQKGTGKWTSQSALDLGVATPTINAAVETRILSAIKEERVVASKVLRWPTGKYDGDPAELKDMARKALYASVIASYAQGLSLLATADKEFSYGLNIAEIARIWKGGCIIRSRLLDPVTEACRARPDLPNLLVAPFFAKVVSAKARGLRLAVCRAADMGIPVLGLSSALGYIDAYRRPRMPADLTQAQRDYFGAHTYERVDKPGTFHTEWLEKH
jgi:6-phosphogluconate dehydrogenase